MRELGKCRVCGKEVGTYAPRGGDGSVRIAYRHNNTKQKKCQGSNREAEWPPKKPTHEAVVIVKCISCKRKKEVRAGEVAPGDMPFCDHCFNVCVAERAEVRKVND